MCLHLEPQPVHSSSGRWGWSFTASLASSLSNTMFWGRGDFSSAWATCWCHGWSNTQELTKGRDGPQSSLLSAFLMGLDTDASWSPDDREWKVQKAKSTNMKRDERKFRRRRPRGRVFLTQWMFWTAGDQSPAVSKHQVGMTGREFSSNLVSHSWLVAADTLPTLQSLLHLQEGANSAS